MFGIVRWPNSIPESVCDRRVDSPRCPAPTNGSGITRCVLFCVQIYNCAQYQNWTQYNLHTVYMGIDYCNLKYLFLDIWCPYYTSRTKIGHLLLGVKKLLLGILLWTFEGYHIQNESGDNT